MFPVILTLLKTCWLALVRLDLVLFVVAADEGIMPQTREHLAILDLLEIRQGIIVLTKIDAVDDPDSLQLIYEDIRKTVCKRAYQTRRYSLFPQKMLFNWMP